MKHYLSLALVSIILSTSAAAAPINPEGEYSCHSIEVGTHELYTGNMSIKKTGTTYTTTSKFNDGTRYKGTGIYDTKSNIMASAAVNINDKNEMGIALNKFSNDGSMSVHWTYLNRKDDATATCKKV